MTVRLDAIKPAVGMKRVFFSRVDTIVRRVRHGGSIGLIVVNRKQQLLDGEHEVHAARRLGLREVEVTVEDRQ